MVFNNVGTLNVSGGDGVDTSDGGGVVVTGDSNVTVSLGRWAGDVSVGAGSILNTNFSQTWKSWSTDPTVANVYVEGTLNLNKTGSLGFDGSNSHYWHIGVDGMINMTGITQINKNNKTWNIELVVSDEAEEITGLSNRVLSNSVEVTRHFLGATQSVAESVDSLTVIKSAGEDTYTAMTLAEENADLTADTYKVVDNGSGKSVVYLGKGYEAQTLVWKGDASATWSDTAAGWYIQNDTAKTDTSFLNGDTVIFDTTASNKNVTISGAVSAASITINDNYTFNVSSDSSVSGVFTIATDKVLTKSGSATLTIIADSGSSINGVNVTEGTLVFDSSTLSSITTQGGTIKFRNSTVNTLTVNGGTTQLDDGSNISDLVIAEGTAKVVSSSTAITKVNIQDGGTLLIDGSGVTNTTKDINIAGGGKLRLDCGNYWGTSFGASDGLISIDASSESPAIIAGGIYGKTTIQSSISGQGVLELRKSETGYENEIILAGVISDDTDGGKLSIIQQSGNYRVNNTNTYTGDTEVHGGSLTLGADNALGQGTWAYVSGGTLDANNYAIANNLVMESGIAQGLTNYNKAIWAMNNEAASTIKNSILSGAVLQVQQGNGYSLTFDNTTGSLGGIVFTMSTLIEGAQISLTNGTSLDLSGLSEIRLDISDTILAGLSTSTTFNLFSLESEQSLTGVDNWNDIFKLYNNNSLVDLSALNLVAQYDMGNLTFALVPEPSTASLSLLGLSALLLRRRRRNG